MSRAAVQFTPIVARFYTLGYGVGLVIITITASINLDYYTTSRHCFLKLGPFLGSVVLPAAVLLSLILGFAFSAYCVLLTAPSHVTEQMDVDLFRTGRPRRDRDTGSILSGSSINISDEERSSKATLHSHGLMIIMFLLTWYDSTLKHFKKLPYFNMSQSIFLGSWQPLQSHNHHQWCKNFLLKISSQFSSAYQQLP